MTKETLKEIEEQQESRIPIKTQSRRKLNPSFWWYIC